MEQFKVEKAAVDTIKNFCLGHDIKLIILDSLVRIHNGNENDAMDMSEVTNQLKQITKHGITIIFTHHNRKSGILSTNLSQEMRGSSDILAAVDSHLAVGSKDSLVTITQTKSRHSAKIKPFQVRVDINNDLAQFEFVGELDDAKGKVEEAKEAIKNLLEQQNQPLYKEQIFKLLQELNVKGGRSTFKTSLDELIDSGDVLVKPGKGNTVFCHLASTEANRSNDLEPEGGGAG